MSDQRRDNILDFAPHRPPSPQKQPSISVADREWLSARETLSETQQRILLAFLTALVPGFIAFGFPFLDILFGALCLWYLFDMVVMAALTLRVPLPPPPNFHRGDGSASPSSPSAELAGDDPVGTMASPWPTYTILCPLYHEQAILPQCVRALAAIDYPAEHLQILFLTERDEDETRQTLKEMALPRHMQVLTVPEGTPRTKPRACNYGLLQARGEYLTIFDAEDIPEPQQLKHAVLTFRQAPEDVACLQARLRFYNPSQNLLTRWFTAEFALWFEILLPAMQHVGMPLPLGGTSNHFRTATLRALGGWDPFNVTEDYDLGLRLADRGLRAIVFDATTYEEANSQFRNWRRQRSRWIKGYLQTYFVHTRRPQRYFQQQRPRDLFWLHSVGAGRALLPLFNAIPWLLLAIYAVLHPFADPIFLLVFPAPVLFLGILAFLLGNFIFLYLHIYTCVKTERYQLLILTPFIPLYWLLMSSAAFVAAKELLFSPHYWAKTRHGLHLRTEREPIVTFTGIPAAPAPDDAAPPSTRAPIITLHDFRKHDATETMPPVAGNPASPASEASPADPVPDVAANDLPPVS